MITEMPCKMAI